MRNIFKFEIPATRPNTNSTNRFRTSNCLVFNELRSRELNCVVHIYGLYSAHEVSHVCLTRTTILFSFWFRLFAGSSFPVVMNFDISRSFPWRTCLSSKCIPGD
jgi:hypothetical protein